MTASKNKVAKQFEANEYPGMPGAFLDRPGGILGNQAALDAVKILDRLGVDHTGHDKLIRELALVAWQLHLRGGGATQDRKRLADAQMRRSQAGTLPTTGIDKEIARYQALVTAAGDFYLDDQMSRRDRMNHSTEALAISRAELQPYRVARIRCGEVEELERQEFDRERAAVADVESFETGRAELNQLSVPVSKLSARAHAALVASCETACSRLGAEAAAHVAPDLAFLEVNPHRTPATVEVLFRQADILDGLIERMGGAPGRGQGSFWQGAGDCAAVIGAKVGLEIPVTERMRRRSPSPDAAMNETY